MDAADLIVYREKAGAFEEVGRIFSSNEGLGFSYSEEYLESDFPQPISRALPLERGALSPRATKSFFDGILPEGSARRLLSGALRASVDDTRALLGRLNEESVGALVFEQSGRSPESGRGYAPLGQGDFERFAKHPMEFATGAARRSRLSLAGAQAKAGLFCDESDGSWHYPQGTAPSSHIVKACDGTFPGQTVNEAICMATAAAMGFDAAECRLIPVEGCEPLIAVRRFDRLDAGGDYLHRLHQEDFLQALPEISLKYEPTDGNYANHCAFLISQESRNPFGDRMLLFSRLLFDWAVGNADNHLKNHSLLWNEDWSAKEVSPLYDITCTTAYANLDREMGVSFGRSRRIDAVTRDDVLATAKACSVGARFALQALEETLDLFPQALRDSVDLVGNQGFPQAEDLGRRIEDSFLKRRDLLA